MNRGSQITEKQKRFYLIIILVFLVVIAIVGYTFDRKETPLRVSFSTKGGGVIFDHQLHCSLDNTSCKECHHNYEEGETGSSLMKCRNCHYDTSQKSLCEDEAIHKRCIGKNCIKCHVAGSVDCEFCHNAEAFRINKAPEKLEFDTDGGKVVFDHLIHSSPEGYDLDCENCHHGYTSEKKKSYPMKCRRCHYNKKYESICETEEIHVRCIGKNCLDCHTDGSEDCNICHLE